MKSHLLSHRIFFFSRRVAEVTEAASLTLAFVDRMAHTSNSDVCFALSASLRDTNMFFLYRKR